MAEEVLLDAHGVKVTPARVVCAGSTYAVANITSVRAVSDNRFRLWGFGFAGIGLLLLAVDLALWPLALMSSGGGAVLIVFGKLTHVVIVTSGAETEAFTSRKEKLALEIASAINLAIIKRAG